MTRDVLKYLQPNAVIPIDMETTILLVNALKKALAEHAMQEVQRLGQEIEQEPVAWQWLGSAHFRKQIPKNADVTAWNPLYTTPPQRTWVGLTGLDQKELMTMSARDAVFATEAKLKEKNT